MAAESAVGATVGAAAGATVGAAVGAAAVAAGALVAAGWVGWVAAGDPQAANANAPISALVGSQIRWYGVTLSSLGRSQIVPLSNDLRLMLGQPALYRDEWHITAA